jgi:hypothetical protein
MTKFATQYFILALLVFDLVFLNAYTHAGFFDADSKKASENTEKKTASTLGSPQAKSIETSKTETPENQERLGKFTFGILGGLAVCDYQMDAANYRISVRSGYNLVYGGSASYDRNDRNWGAEIRGMRTTLGFNLSQVTPASAESERSSYYGLVKLGVPALLDGMFVFGGYNYFSKASTQTAPKIILPSSESHSLVTGVGYRFTSGPIFLDARLAGMVPLLHQESSSSSGTRRTAFAGETTISIGVKPTDLFSIGISPVIRYEYFDFRGDSPRGFRDALEKDWMLAIPLEVRLSL